MFATWLDTNSWLLEMAGQRLLVDPWLVGPLVFGNQEWLFKGERPRPLPDIGPVDLILLSQGLEDHAHPPTLKSLDKSIPVVGSASAAKVARALGYTEVTALAPGETFVLKDLVEIKAVPGSPMGPTVLENGYVLRDRISGHSLFYEPHGYNQPALQAEAPVDVVITPVLDLALPLIGPVIRGQKSALDLAERLQPQIILPTADAGEVQYQGLLLSLLKVIGSATAMQAELDQRGLKTQVLQLLVGSRTELPLTSRPAPVTR
ncbi:MAG: MBL fold metallo-hydrolase [Cyanobacteria bacterium Co-bin8]|nr:MBL fold metallo-hydrolase [Cyanobacteria bacterium Co-bin8]